MVEVYIYDAIRTPRGCGKAPGALHEVKPTALAAESGRRPQSYYHQISACDLNVR